MAVSSRSAMLAGVSRRFRALAAAALLVGGCGFGGAKLEQRTTEGPLAEDFFALRIAVRTGRSASFDERRRWRSEERRVGKECRL